MDQLGVGPPGGWGGRLMKLGTKPGAEEYHPGCESYCFITAWCLQLRLVRVQM